MGQTLSDRHFADCAPAAGRMTYDLLPELVDHALERPQRQLADMSVAARLRVEGRHALLKEAQLVPCHDQFLLAADAHNATSMCIIPSRRKRAMGPRRNRGPPQGREQATHGKFLCRVRLMECPVGAALSGDLRGPTLCPWRPERRARTMSAVARPSFGARAVRTSLLALAACLLAAAPLYADDAEDAAERAVQKLGGRVVRFDQYPQPP